MGSAQGARRGVAVAVCLVIGGGVAAAAADRQAGTRTVVTALGRANAAKLALDKGDRTVWTRVLRSPGGGYSFESLEIGTPYGRSRIVEVEGELQNQIDVGGEIFLVDRGRDGRLVYRNSAGRSFREGEVMRTADGRWVTEHGPVRLVKTATGTEELVPGPGTSAGRIETRYGDSRIVEVDGELRNELTLGDDTYLVGRGRKGEVVFRDARGRRTREGEALRALDGRRQTKYGPASRVETALGHREAIKDGQSWDTPYRFVEWGRGDAYTLSAGKLETPYGRARVAERDGRLRLELTLGEDVYLVDQRRDGAIAYRDARGRLFGPGRPLRSADGRPQTAAGPATTLVTANGPVPVIEKRGKYHRVEADGSIARDSVADYTHYGRSKVVEIAGRLVHRLTIGTSVYTVGQDADGQTVFKDRAGRISREDEPLYARDGRVQTSAGPLEEVETALGPQPMVVKRPSGYSKEPGVFHIEKDWRDRPVPQRSDLETPFGKARVVGRPGRRRLEVQVRGVRYLVAFGKDGITYLDPDGRRFGPGEPIRNAEGRLVTPFGVTQVIETATGQAEVLRRPGKRKGDPPRWQLVRYKDGELVYRDAEVASDFGEPARVVRREGALRLEVRLARRRYLVARRGDQLSYRAEGAAAVEAWPSDFVKPAAPVRLRSPYRPELAPLDDDQTWKIGGYSHGSGAEYRDLRDAALDIIRKYPPSQYVYVGVGRSPSALFAFLENLAAPDSGTFALLFPSGGLRNGQPVQRQDAYDEHFRALLPPDVRYGRRRILLVDRSNPGSGASIVNLQGMLKAYLAAIGSPTRVEGVGISAYRLGYGLDVLDSSRKKTLDDLSQPAFEALSKYPSHTIGYDRLEKVSIRPEYAEYRQVLLERMARDEKLDQALANLP